MGIALHPQSREAYTLFHRAQKAFADMEVRGIHVDVDYLERTDRELSQKIEATTQRLKGRPEGVAWMKWAGNRFKPLSDDQIAHVLTKIAGVPLTKLTEGRALSTEDEVLEEINLPIAKDILELRSLEKIRGTYIRGLLRENVDGRIHPSFSLLNVTYRSACMEPNAQNFPIRDPDQGRWVRRGIRARPGFQIGEGDFKGVEVGVSICYHKDRNMMAYWRDRSKDMHRDSASDCFDLAVDQVTKAIRHVGKNRFVFPEFYGSYFMQVAPDLWKAAQDPRLVTVAGVPLLQHLASRGLSRYRCPACERNVDEPRRRGSKRCCFENHIRLMEERFWNERFPDYKQWRQDQWDRYQRQGFVDLKTGFRCQGVMRKNEVINYPIQGAAFHCMLWTLCELNDWMRAQRMRSYIVGQIHDSILLDLDPAETFTVFSRMNELVTVHLPAHWEWIIVPLEAEYEVAGVDQSWHDKKPYSLAGAAYSLAGAV